MNGPRWDDEMKFELFRLRSELRTENFRVLATPLGLGRMRVEKERSEKPLYPPMRVFLPVRPALAAQSKGQALQIPGTRGLADTASISQESRAPAIRRDIAQPASMPTDRPLASFPAATTTDNSRDKGSSFTHRPWLRWVFVHLLDLGFVMICLALGLVALGFILDPSNMSWTPEHLGQAVPLQILRRLQSWMLVIGIYMVFAIYWLFFKFVSGATLGETCLPKFVADEEQVAAAPDNTSGET